MVERKKSASRTISWFSCGAASAVATKLMLTENPATIPVYCEMFSEHEDNARFLSDCERWFDRPVVRIRSDKYVDTWDVWEKRKYLCGPDGAACTVELKVKPRLEFQHPTDHHVFGYTSDSLDKRRADAMRANHPELNIRTPLIERGLDKNACLGLITRAGIELPVMYRLGFGHNNCLPCVKARSPGYWALVRKEAPVQFARMAELSRRLGVRLCVIGGERKFIDEVPSDYPTTTPLAPSCDFLCQMMEQDL